MVTILGSAFLVPVTAHADVTPELSLAISSLTTTGTKPTDRLTIKGTLTNASSIPAYGVQAMLWRSKDPVRDQASLQSIASGSNTWGGRLSGPGKYLLITNSTTAFAPGASRTFTLTATLAELGFDTTGVAYAIGVDVIGTSDQSSNYVLAAQFRSFVPMPGKHQVPVTTTVLLSAPPTKLSDSLFANDNLTAELTGQLSSLLTAATDSGASWLIDPSLLDEVRDQADGYQVVDGNSTKDGTGQQAAADWLVRFAKLDRSRGGRTLFANPDTYSAQTTSTKNLLAWSETASDAVEGLDDLPLVVIPTGRVVSKSSLEFLASSGAAAIIASNTRSAASLQSSSGSIPLLVAVSTLSVAPSSDPTTAIKQRQLTLAATALSGTQGQLRLLTTADDLTQNSATRPSWVTERDLDDLLRQAPAKKASLIATKPEHLTDDQWNGLRRAVDDVSGYDDLVTDSQITKDPEATYLRTVSTSWITDQAAGHAYSESLSNLIGRPAVSERIRLDASSRFLMSARSNQFPVTVTNELSESIQVRVEVTTDNPQRLTIPPSELVTVGPGQSQTVNIRPEATANGVVTADAHVATANGHRVTADVPLTIEVTDLGVVAWIIVAVSGVVLVAATAWRIRQVRRRDRLAAETAKAANQE
jgi:hypothetical protein